MNNISNLQSMTREQLVELAMRQGLPKPHHKAKPETIIKQIVDSIQAPKQDMKHVAEKPAVPVFTNTPEQVLEAIKSITDRNPDFEAKFTEDTWHFRRRVRGILAEDSGNLNIPLRVIVQKARNVAQGPLLMRGLSKSDFGSIGGNPNSAYADVVIAG